MFSRTRVKICGITLPEDGMMCAKLGADAIGLVFYPPSPRFVSIERANDIVKRLPPFVCTIGLFVNPSVHQVIEVLTRFHLSALQFHGEESNDFCKQFNVPYIKAVRVQTGLDLIKYARPYSSAQALLFDSHVDGYGGSGKTFDWDLIPEDLPLPIIMSGGLNAENVAAAIKRFHPWGVDISSGVESEKGIKDQNKVAAFIKEVNIANS